MYLKYNMLSLNAHKMQGPQGIGALVLRKSGYKLPPVGLEYRLNGNQDYCVNSTINVCIPGVISEALMISSKQYCSLSNGSACTSKAMLPVTCFLQWEYLRKILNALSELVGVLIQMQMN